MKRESPSKPLTEDRIVETALEIVDSQGLEGLTMRRLGAELGVDPMMIYRHVPNKEGLLDLALERMRREMSLPDPLPEDPSELLEAVFVAYHGLLAAHPHMIPLATRRTDMSAQSGLEYIIELGLAPDEAVQLFQSLTAFTIGFAALGAPAVAGDWERFPDPLVDRLRDWREDTLKRTIRLMLAGYGVVSRKDQS